LGVKGDFMGNPLAILAGALIIGLSILFVGRWSVVAGSNIDPRELSYVGVYRLDRWTGAVTWCGRALYLPSIATASPLTCDVRK
jgi:hypothetical protein